MMIDINIGTKNTPLEADAGSDYDTLCPRLESPGDQLPDPSKRDALPQSFHGSAQEGDAIPDPKKHSR